MENSPRARAKVKNEFPDGKEVGYTSRRLGPAEVPNPVHLLSAGFGSRSGRIQVLLLKMTLGGLFLHPRRTALILFSVAVSVFFMEIFAGMGQGITANFFETILNEGGHGQVRGIGWEDQYDPQSLAGVLTTSSQILEFLQNQDRMVRAEAILGYGTVYLPSDGQFILLNTLGVQGDSEFFPKVSDGLEEGAFLPLPESILISRSLADFLQLKLGEEIRLLAEDIRGAPRSRTFGIHGIFSTDSREFDDSTVLVNLEMARGMVRVPDGSTEIRFLLDDRGYAVGFSKSIQSQVSDLGGSIHDWRELNQGILLLVDMTDIFIWVFNLIMMIVAATVITNAILMNVFDRMGEYGTLRAIGMHRSTILGVVILEGTVLGVAGSLLGVALGIPVILYFQENGLDWGGVTESLGMGSFFTFGYSPARSLVDFFAGTLTAVLGSLYAGLVVYRTKVVHALKEN